MMISPGISTPHGLVCPGPDWGTTHGPSTWVVKLSPVGVSWGVELGCPDQGNNDSALSSVSIQGKPRTRPTIWEAMHYQGASLKKHNTRAKSEYTRGGGSDSMCVTRGALERLAMVCSKRGKINGPVRKTHSSVLVANNPVQHQKTTFAIFGNRSHLAVRKKHQWCFFLSCKALR